MRLKTTRSPGANGSASQIFKIAAVVQDLRYTYDPAGNITRISDDALPVIAYNNQQVSPVADYTYDAVYRLIEAHGREHVGQAEFAPNASGDGFRDYPFAGFGANPNDLQALRNYVERYEYDDAGNSENLIHQAGPNGSWTRAFAYNEPSLIEPGKRNNRLSGATVGQTTETYAHDAHGNMTAMPHLPLMQWNFKDELRSSSKQVVNSGNPETTFYVYDAPGERARKVTERQNGARKNERIYLDGFELYREYDVNGAVTLQRETLHIMDDKRRIALVETKTIESGVPIDTPAPLQIYQLGNHLGSASLELDKDGGLISYEEYHPYGTTAYQAMSSAAEVSLKRYRYTGRERDEETGLSYHSARHYAPWLARWTSADPDGMIDGPNLYRYVRNNPLVLVDHNGKDPALPNDTRTNEERNLSYSDPAAAAAAYKTLAEQERRALRDRVYGTTPKDPDTKRERPSVTLVDMARALAPTTFQAIKPSERLKDAPPGIAQMYGGGAQDDIASMGANVAKKTVEHGGNAALIAGDIGLSGIQIGFSGVRSMAARSVEKEVVKETLGKTAEKGLVETAVKLVPKPKSGLDKAVGEGAVVVTVRLKTPAEAILNHGALKRGTVAVATHGAEQVHITTGKAVRVLTGKLAEITEERLIQIAKGGVAALEKTGVKATK